MGPITLWGYVNIYLSTYPIITFNKVKQHCMYYFSIFWTLCNNKDCQYTAHYKSEKIYDSVQDDYLILPLLK